MLYIQGYTYIKAGSNYFSKFNYHVIKAGTNFHQLNSIKNNQIIEKNKNILLS